MVAGFAMLNDRREANRTRGADGAKKEADAIGEAAFTLFKAIKSAHGDTRGALRTVDPDCDLHKLGDTLLHLMQTSADVVTSERFDKPATIGRPTSRAAQMIADLVLLEFEACTGARATITTRHDKRGSPAEGAYLDLVRTVFEIFKVGASAESQGRAAIDRRKAGIEPGGSGGMVSIRHVKGEKAPEAEPL
jgi:hypothetical protein